MLYLLLQLTVFLEACAVSENCLLLVGTDDVRRQISEHIYTERHTDIVLQVSLQAIALDKINETSARLVSSLRQGICDRVCLDFLRVIIHCSPTNLDAAISLGEELINFFLKTHIDNQTQRELFCCIGHITRNFQASSLLHEAARRGNVQQLQRLLQNRRGCVDVQRFFSEKDKRGKTPLMWACLNNSVDVIKFCCSMEWIFMRGTSPDKRHFSTLAEVTRERFSNFWRGGEHVSMILTTTANMVSITRRSVTRARYSSCCFKNYKQMFILKTGNIDFQFITLRRQARLRTFCFYIRTVAAEIGRHES